MFIKTEKELIPILRWDNEDRQVTLWFAAPLTNEQIKSLILPEISIAEDKNNSICSLPGPESIKAIGYTYTVKPDAERTLEAEKDAILAIAAQVMSDEQAQGYQTMWPVWKEGNAYENAVVVAQDGILYRCIQAHTAQSDWKPQHTPALWKRLGVEDNSPDAIESWMQPQGANDAYQKGERVAHGGKEWVSTADNNVWEPGVYGWEIVVEE